MCGITLSSLTVTAPSITVNTSSINSTAIPLTWTSAGSVVNSYDVMWTPGGGECSGVSGGSDSVDGDTVSHTIEGLEEYTTYTITVTATNDVGSAISDQATGRTSEDSKWIFSSCMTPNSCGVSYSLYSSICCSYICECV